MLLLIYFYKVAKKIHTIYPCSMSEWEEKKGVNYKSHMHSSLRQSHRKAPMEPTGLNHSHFNYCQELISSF